MIHLLVACLLFGATGCDKKDKAPDFYWGELEMEYDNRMLGGQPHMNENYFLAGTWNLQVNLMGDNDSEVIGHLSVVKIPSEVKRTKLAIASLTDSDSLTGARFDILAGADATLGSFDLVLEGYDNYIEITEIAGDEVYGNFQIAFKQDSLTILYGSFELPDTLVFTEGYFHARISE